MQIRQPFFIALRSTNQAAVASFFFLRKKYPANAKPIKPMTIVAGSGVLAGGGTVTGVPPPPPWILTIGSTGMPVVTSLWNYGRKNREGRRRRQQRGNGQGHSNPPHPASVLNG